MADMTGLTQPIIRGIQAVGSVQIFYKYNGNSGKMYLPSNLMFLNNASGKYIDTGKTAVGVIASGYRLDGEFVRASQQISSSAVIPILGGGGVALTNNNRTGSISFTNTKVSTPEAGDTNTGSMYSPDSGSAIGVLGGDEVYDLSFLATVQQGQLGGDSAGATITVKYAFCDLCTVIVFEGCTVASVDPLALSGNDAANYPVVFNYLNWKADYSISQTATSPITPAASS